jgi:ABC-type spermidine/putrescine transport system permease subunit II
MRGASIPGLTYPAPRPAASRIVWAAYAGAIYLFLYAPLAVLVVLSFNDTENVTLPWMGFTLRWYHKLAGNSELIVALGNSIKLGLLTAALSVPCGVLTAYAFRRRFVGRGALFNLFLVALIAPPIIVGVGQSIFWNIAGIRSGLYTTTLAAHVIYTVPFVFILIFPTLERFPANLEEAAMDLGASRVRMFLTVVLPIIRPGVIAASVFVFMLSFDEFIRTLFVIGVDNTLPIYLWSMIMSSVSPETNAIASIIVLTSIVLMLLGYRVMSQGFRGNS